jgi:hypothetical protein
MQEAQDRQNRQRNAAFFNAPFSFLVFQKFVCTCCDTVCVCLAVVLGTLCATAAPPATLLLIIIMNYPLGCSFVFNQDHNFLAPVHE